jgi:hypothetical protein
VVVEGGEGRGSPGRGREVRGEGDRRSGNGREDWWGEREGGNDDWDEGMGGITRFLKAITSSSVRVSAFAMTGIRLTLY